MTEFLTFRDDAGFVGMEKKEPQPPSYWHKTGLPHECPKCRGCGGWILSHDRYGEGRHFKASCMDCNGWGFVAEPVDHQHEWVDGTTVGRCLTNYKCKVCGQPRTIDSSD